MSDINPLGASTYYAGLHNATNQASKDSKKEKINSSERLKFTDLLKTNKDSSSDLSTQGYPPEIANMSLDDAAVFLRDIVDVAGNNLSASPSTENIQEFKKAVKQFIKFVTDNNYEEHKKERRGFAAPMQYFSKYNTKKRPKDPRVIIQTIDSKLDGLVRDTLLMQSNNLKILEKVNEIKGLIVDLMQA